MGDLLSLRETLARTGLSRTSLWRYRQAGTFPRGVSIGHLRAVLFRAEDVEAWVAANAPQAHRDP